MTAKDLSIKLGTIWKVSQLGSLYSLVRDFFEFHFCSAEDKAREWSLETYIPKLGFFRL